MQAIQKHGRGHFTFVTKTPVQQYIGLVSSLRLDNLAAALTLLQGHSIHYGRGATYPIGTSKGSTHGQAALW